MLKRQHPTEAELFEYAETLVANHVAFDSKVARHLRSCPCCGEEIASIRNSLEVIRDVDDLKPGKDSEAAVLLAARPRNRRSGLGLLSIVPRSSLGRGVALAAGLLVMTSTVLHSSRANAPLQEATTSVSMKAAPQELHTAGFSLDALMRATAEEELLGAALASPAWSPRSPWEQAQRRALNALEDDIDEALEALKHNPALARAGAVVNSNRERKKETLKVLYANRNL